MKQPSSLFVFSPAEAVFVLFVARFRHNWIQRLNTDENLIFIALCTKNTTWIKADEEPKRSADNHQLTT